MASRWTDGQTERRRTGAGVKSSQVKSSQVNTLHSHKCNIVPPLSATPTACAAHAKRRSECIRIDTKARRGQHCHVLSSWSLVHPPSQLPSHLTAFHSQLDSHSSIHSIPKSRERAHLSLNDRSRRERGSTVFQCGFHVGIPTTKNVLKSGIKSVSGVSV